MREYPKEFLEEMRELLGEQYGAYVASCANSPVRALHVNLNKIEPQNLMGLLPYPLTPIPFAPDGFYLGGEEKVGNHPLHHAGAYYVQEPSAMTPVCSLKLERGMWVADLCASPGGKSTQLANRVGEEGFLLSNEIMPARCATLAGNLERMGLRNTLVTNTDTDTLAKRYPECFDAVVVDAPCSGEGMFRKDEGARAAWNRGNVEACAERQRQILSAAAKMVCPGGQLLYSTCTFSTLENEATLLDFLSTHPEFSLAEAGAEVEAVTSPAVLLPDSGEIGVEIATHARRFYPHVSPGEGQFLARMVKAGDAPAARGTHGLPTPKREEMAVWDAFLKETFLPGVLPTPCLFKGSLCLVDKSVAVDEKITYACGVRAGRVEKGRVVPEHWLFTAYGHACQRRLSLHLDDPRVEKYLRGEAIPCDLPRGWACVEVEGCTLGGVKVSDGMAKNHYPKGLRLM